MKLSELFFGTIITDEKGNNYRFLNHCFCKDNVDPEITIVDKDGNNIDKRLSEVQTWKILKKS